MDAADIIREIYQLGGVIGATDHGVVLAHPLDGSFRPDW